MKSPAKCRRSSVAVACRVRDVRERRPISRSIASGVNSAWASIGSMSSTPYRYVVSMPFARRARAIVSTITGPRRLPTWTVPEGVFFNR